LSTSGEYVERSVALVGSLDGCELTPHAILLLSQGEPVALERLAAAAGRPLGEVEAALRGVGNLEWDERGRLVGLALTLRPTPHRFTVAGRTLFAWCASDALMFPIVLGRPGVVDSVCPGTGRAIHIELTPTCVERLDPPEAVVSMVRPARTVPDVRAAICDHGHFFVSAVAASSWADDHPEGYVHRVEEAFLLDRQVLRRLGWDAPNGR
jgi:alkylmercury lyase